MQAEQLVIDAIILNDWIKENKISIRDCAKVFNYYYEEIAKHKFQNDVKYFIKLQKKLRYERI